MSLDPQRIYLCCIVVVVSPMCESYPVIFALELVYFAISKKDFMIIEECDGLWLVLTSHSIPNNLLKSPFRVLSLVFLGGVHLLIEDPSFPTVFGFEQYLISSPVRLSPI